MISVVFVGMMVFLVPSLVEEANAGIIGQAFATTGTTFSDIKGGMKQGIFWDQL